jgi:hypothetical protein
MPGTTGPLTTQARLQIGELHFRGSTDPSTDRAAWQQSGDAQCLRSAVSPN